MSRIGARPLSQLCRRLGMALDAGLDIRRAAQQEAQRGPFAQRTVMEKISEKLGRGESFATAVAEADGAFPPLVCEMVDVGERTGRLEQVLLRLAEHYDHLLSLRRTFLVGITMPAIQLALAVIVIGLFIWIIGLVAGPDDDAANVLGPGMSGTKGLIRYIGIVTVLFGTPALFVTALLKGWLPDAPIWAILIRVPILGSCIKAMALSRFSWSLAMATDAGIDAQRSLKLAQRSTNNGYYTSGMFKVQEVIARGQEMHEALRSTGLYPDEFLDTLENAEQAGKVSETMVITARDYQSRAEAAAATLTTVASFLVWALVAGVIIYFIFRLAMVLYIGPIYDALEMTQ